MNKSQILKKNYEIEELVNNKQCIKTKYFTLYYKKEDIDSFKIAFSISKKAGNAIVRNYRKRIVKEIVRDLVLNMHGIKMLLVIRINAVSLDYDGTKEQLKFLFKLLDEKEKLNEKL